jgi:hypothetical protein
MKKVALFFTATLLMISYLPATIAAEKLDVRVELGAHPYLPGYEFGKTGAFGDVWMLNVEVLDADGEPSEGARVRIYNGKKSVGSGRVGVDGIAEVKFILNKLGAQNLRVVASDDEPSGKGEVKFDLEVVKPRMLQATKRVIGIQEYEPNLVSLVLDGQVLLNAGCKDMNKFWMTGGDAATTAASWPFYKSKRKEPLSQRFQGNTIDEIIKFQNTSFPLVDDYKSRPGYILSADDFSLSVDDRDIMCQTDSGELLLLK